MADSPYKGKPESSWIKITKDLVEKYPLSCSEILDIALLSWSQLWDTKVGETITLKEVELPATVVGYFFQKLFAHELSQRYETEWRGEKEKSDKDLVNILHPEFSTEMKSSGQMGYKIFGNRSYNQESENNSVAGKDKSGYYICMNFYGQVLTLLRIGWIDQEDWKPQGAETGQAAILDPKAYSHKLIKIPGAYQLKSPVGLLYDVGKTTIVSLNKNNIYTFKDILVYQGNDRGILKVISKNSEILDTLRQFL